ncbi:hypothetical protein E2C01_080025 [Portunus trituberculatus]|uniref:Uncharacterized protein n=1 Tax=Portunus trituberculatus TaxID=210409 RepID=A0A5B7IL31_PORTR|nr:hypothetical protein [Portunus trituberculatus]
MWEEEMCEGIVGPRTHHLPRFPFPRPQHRLARVILRALRLLYGLLERSLTYAIHAEGQQEAT